MPYICVNNFVPRNPKDSGGALKKFTEHSSSKLTDKKKGHRPLSAVRLRLTAAGREST